MLTEPEADRLLNDLCIKLGFCLPPAEHERLRQHPPRDLRAFIDAVFIAEGLDVERADRQLLRQVREMVAAAFDSSGD